MTIPFSQVSDQIPPPGWLAHAWMPLAALACAGALSGAELYVAANGSDAVAYAANSISTPWKTINHAVYNLKAGDTLNMRGGTYALAYPMLLRSDYASKTYGGAPDEDMNAQSGTVDHPVTIRSYPGETAILDAAATPGTVFNIQAKNYWRFVDFTVVNAGSAFYLGEDQAADHITFDNLVITANRGGDNSGCIKIYAELVTNTTITNCTLTGPGTGGSIHQNTAVIWLSRTSTAIIANNRLSNAPIGIYYKHVADPQPEQSQVDLQITNNYITDTSRGSMQLNCRYAVVSNNIIGPNNAGIRVAEGNGAPGGDFNQFIHNTFFGSDLALTKETQDYGNPPRADPYPGAIGNTVRDNVFCKPVVLHNYTTYATLPSNSIFDHNIYLTGLVNVAYSELYTLPNWFAATSGIDPGLDKVGSSAGAIAFVGGASPSAIADFALTATSPGHLAASDGTDAGANVALVGPNAGSPASGNHAPVASTLSATTTEDTATAISLMATDADGDALTYAIVADPTHGTLSGSGTSRTYTPSANYAGSDSFTFRANDGTANSNVATVSITVTAVNDVPVANAQSTSTAQATAKDITLAGTDAEGSVLTYAIVASPAHGVLSGSDSHRTYTPDAGFTGSDSFTFTVNDGALTSPAATVSITVTASASPTPPATSGGAGGGCGAGGAAGLIVGLGLTLRLRNRRR